MASSKRAGRDERIRKELFTAQDDVVFDTKTKGFVPLPIEFRLLFRHLTLAQLRVLLYLHLRSGKEGISFPTVDEIAHDLGVKTAKHVRPVLLDLVEKGFLRTAQKSGRGYFLVLDPSIAIRTLLKRKEMSLDQLREINEVRENIGHEPVEAAEEDSND